jgi:NhaA family Na+:H+ antiporter
MKEVIKGKQTTREQPVERLLRPFQEFAKLEASGGILLLLCTVTALVWANSPWADTYFSFWRTTLTVGFGEVLLSKPLLLWINDGLMAVFFFVVGLEIKREVLVGELNSVRKAALPIVAALGGALVPAGIYLGFNAGTAGSPGWGIPMATDIAFALGVLALLGRRVPLALKVFLAALAIVDDIVAVLVIAFFYTAEISWTSLAIGAGFLLLLVAANRAGVRHPLVYALLGLGLWLAFLKSGVHATVAGVLLAMTIPSRARINTEEFLAQSRALLDEFERAGESGESILTNADRQAALHTLEIACERVAAPIERFEHALHPWVTFAIMPVFALANAGVALGGDVSAAVTSSISVGIIVGLVVGKQVGITLFSWLVVRSGFAVLPGEVTWRHIYGASWLAGIGFTMSLFIAGLAFGDSPLLDLAKVGILAASLTAGVVGWFILNRTITIPRVKESVR